ncbi:MAG: TonB-dependent receptor [Candidatus Azobacteroides sp.]|nr:TonB-dependent receptor [Candidatus Azobacteroides sp.]
MKGIYVLLGIMFLALNVFAEEEKPDTLSRRSVVLDEIVVQSFKQGGNLSVLPMAASTINRKNLQNQNVWDIKDISSFIPNLYAPDYGAKISSPVYIRGIGSKINAPSVGLYVDGIPYFEKSAFDFDLNEIDYIEVLRGPQGTLYGRNTMGGIINVYTKSPLQYQGTYISASGGNYTNLNATLGYYGKINNQFGYAVSGNYNHTDGYFLNHYTGKNADGMNSGSGRVRLEWRIRPDLSLRLTQSVDYSNQGGYPYAPIDSTGRVTDVNYNEYSSYIRTLSSTGLSLTYKANRYQLNSQTSFQYLSDKQGIDQDFTAQSVYFVTQKQKQYTFSEEINIKSTANHWYQWLFGAFAFNEQIDNNVVMDYERLYYSTRKLYDMPTRGISFYHQSGLNNILTDRLSLTLGIRYDYEKASNDYTAYKDSLDLRQPLGGDFSSTMDFSQLTPKVALQYTLPSSQMFYASVTRGYKTGGFNTSFEREEDRSFKPEYSWNYEIGAKGRFWENRIRAELCFFYIDWKNQQIYQTLPSGRGQMLKNAGHSRSRGIELSLQGNLWKGFFLQANGGITDAIFLDYVQSATIDYSKNHIPSVPAQTLGLAADYLIPLRSKLADHVSVNLQYIGTGKLYWNEDNKVSQPYYGLLNGKISASKGIATVSIWAKNITNAEYMAYSFALSNQQYAQKGRLVTVGVSVNLLIK